MWILTRKLFFSNTSAGWLLLWYFTLSSLKTIFCRLTPFKQLYASNLTSDFFFTITLVFVHGKNLRLCRNKEWQLMLDKSKSIPEYYCSTTVSILAIFGESLSECDNKFADCDEDDNSMTLSKLSPFPSKTICWCRRHSSYLTNLTTRCCCQT